VPRVTEEQTTFLPEERYTPTFSMLAVERVTGNTLEPGADFIENVRQVGLLNPISVIAQSNGTYKLAAGRRRLHAVREIGLTFVPATVYPVGTPQYVASAMAISENVQRRPNPLTDLQAIEEMIRAGANEQSIASELHLPVGTIRARLRLQALAPDLRNALEAGTISPSVAERAARLDSARQMLLVATLVNNGRLTNADVSAVLRVRAEEQLEALPDEVFTPPVQLTHEVPEEHRQQQAAEPTPLPTVSSWASVLECLVRAHEVMPVASDGDMESAAAWLNDLSELVNTIIRNATPIASASATLSTAGVTF
jgi:ParB/RepB/Spo0J family partition protein